MLRGLEDRLRERTVCCGGWAGFGRVPLGGGMHILDMECPVPTVAHFGCECAWAPASSTKPLSVTLGVCLHPRVEQGCSDQDMRAETPAQLPINHRLVVFSFQLQTPWGFQSGGSSGPGEFLLADLKCHFRNGALKIIATIINNNNSELTFVGCRRERGWHVELLHCWC